MDKVQHFEIPVDKEERAMKFYKDTFDWNFMPMPEMQYTMVHTGKTDKVGMIQEKGVINGGMLKRNKNIKSPVITITVEDIEKTISKVKMNGGKLIIEKMKAGDMGFTAYVEDSEKNIIGLWQSTRKM